MTATTLDTTTTARRDYEISEALHTVADLYYRGSLPEAKFPEQPIIVGIVVASRDDVEKFAVTNGIELNLAFNDDGSITTTADLTVEPNAVTVQIIHVARAV